MRKFRDANHVEREIAITPDIVIAIKDKWGVDITAPEGMQAVANLRHDIPALMTLIAFVVNKGSDIGLDDLAKPLADAAVIDAATSCLISEIVSNLPKRLRVEIKKSEANGISEQVETIIRPAVHSRARRKNKGKDRS